MKKNNLILILLVLLLTITDICYARLPIRDNDSGINPLFLIKSSPDDVYWESGFGPPLTESPEVKSVTYSNGYFYAIDDSRVFQFSESTGYWTYIGILKGGNINVLKAKDGLLYIGGSFTGISGSNAKNFAIWDGTKWDSLGASPDRAVYTIDVSSDKNIFIGGEFQKIGNTDANHLAYWNGKSWNAMGAGTDGLVRTIFAKGDSIVAGGDFTMVDTIYANRIAIWSRQKSNWSALGLGLGGSGSFVFSACILNDGRIVAGGNFSVIPDMIADNIAIWDGISWANIADGFDNFVFSVSEISGKLYAGGYFTASGQTAINRIAEFDGSKWKPLGNGLRGDNYPSVLSLSEGPSGKLYAAGTFSKAGNENCNGLAFWDGNNWSDPLANNRNGIRSMVSDFVIGGTDNYLFAGGGFVKSGEAESHGITKFDGKRWFGCGGGLTPMADVVYSMFPFGEDIYFTGWFNRADGTDLNNVAVWKDKKKVFESVGRGIDGADGTLGPIIVEGNDIFVGGLFKESGGMKYNYIAKYDGSSWKQIGTEPFLGIRNITGVPRVECFAADSDHNLYIGGVFDSAGSIAAKNIVCYNTKTGEFTNIGNGLPSAVYKIVVIGDTLIFCGNFKSAGNDTNIRNIAFWNRKTNTWSGFNGFTNGTVYTILKWFDDYYIGGSFTKAGDAECNGIAKYNTATGKFESLGSGLWWGLSPGSVSALAIYKNKLYAGGSFLNAGNKVSTNFAAWTNIITDVKQNEPVSIIDAFVSPNPATDFIEISCPPSIKKGLGGVSDDVKTFNVYGETVLNNSQFSILNSQLKIDVSGLAPGVYFVMVGDKVMKFLKVR